MNPSMIPLETRAAAQTDLLHKAMLRPNSIWHRSSARASTSEPPTSVQAVSPNERRRVRNNTSKAPRKPRVRNTALSMMPHTVATLLDNLLIPIIPYDTITLKQAYYGFGDIKETPPMYGIIKSPFDNDELASNTPVLKGFIISCTGVLNFMERSEVQSMVQAAGGKFQKTFGKSVNLLLAGKDSGPSKIATARQLCIPCIDDDALVRLIGALRTQRNSDVASDTT